MVACLVIAAETAGLQCSDACNDMSIRVIPWPLRKDHSFSVDPAVRTLLPLMLLLLVL